MLCPKCERDSRVVETRSVAGNMQRRRRVCSDVNCNNKFTTIETVVETNARHSRAVVLVVPRHLAEAIRKLLAVFDTALGEEKDPDEKEPTDKIVVS